MPLSPLTALPLAALLGETKLLVFSILPSPHFAADSSLAPAGPGSAPPSFPRILLSTFTCRSPQAGGHQTSPAPAPLEHHDSYELSDYGLVHAHSAASQAQSLEQAQRERKRRWLLAQDEMKFSHSIQFNAVPDWSSHYIAYSNLKKL